VTHTDGAAQNTEPKGSHIYKENKNIKVPQNRAETQTKHTEELLLLRLERGLVTKLWQTMTHPYIYIQERHVSNNPPKSAFATSFR
jgi:hypothetical protein